LMIRPYLQISCRVRFMIVAVRCLFARALAVLGVEQISNDVTKDLLARLVRERSLGARENRLECSCGAWALYKGQRRRTIVTAYGEVTFERACYHCPQCRKVLVPQDRSMGLDQGTSTQQVRLW